MVEVMEVKPVPLKLTTQLIGRLDSPHSVKIRARVEGIVDKMHFTEGEPIQEGELLFELDRKPFQEALAAAEGALAEAKASLGKSQKDVERLEPLVASQAVPKQELDNAKAALAAARANVDSAAAKVETARLNLGYCELRAPIAGLIGASQVSTGDLVGRGEPTLMATIFKLDPIRFFCNVSEVDYLQAQAKSRQTGRDVNKVPVTLILPNGAEHPEIGHFIFIDNEVNPKTGTLQVRAEFPNQQKFLRPGMFARVRVDLGTRENTILLPQRAVVDLQGKSFAWAVTADGTANRRQIETGERTPEGVVITSGLQPGDRVVVEGLQKVREGAKVTALTAAQLAAMAGAPVPPAPAAPAAPAAPPTSPAPAPPATPAAPAAPQATPTPR
jgi:membrane fusion protein (multidrug efflux system)